MLWFKHFARSHDDGKLCRLKDKFGAEGYGVWWTILERIASDMDGPEPSTTLEASLKNWSKSCGISPKKFQKIAEFLTENGNLLAVVSGDYCEISCPNLLKYKDEYSKKSGHKREQYPESVRQEQKQKQIKKQKQTAASKVTVTSEREADPSKSLPAAAGFPSPNPKETESDKEKNQTAESLAILKWFKVKDSIAKRLASEYSLRHIRKAAEITIDRMNAQSVRNPSGLFLTILQDENLLESSVYENLQAEERKHEEAKLAKERKQAQVDARHG